MNEENNAGTEEAGSVTSPECSLHRMVRHDGIEGSEGTEKSDIHVKNADRRISDGGDVSQIDPSGDLSATDAAVVMMNESPELNVSVLVCNGLEALDDLGKTGSFGSFKHWRVGDGVVVRRSGENGVIRGINYEASAARVDVNGVIIATALENLRRVGMPNAIEISDTSGGRAR